MVGSASSPLLLERGQVTRLRAVDCPTQADDGRPGVNAVTLAVATRSAARRREVILLIAAGREAELCPPVIISLIVFVALPELRFV